MTDYFLIAKIDAVFGKDGFVKITSFSDFPDRFFNLKKVYLDFFGDKKEFRVEKVKKQKSFLVLKFYNFNSSIDASNLVGKDVFVLSQDSVELPEDYFFIHDLIGSKVYKDEILLGKIIDVLKYPANDVYVIKNDLNNEILIPAVKDFIERFDQKEKILILKPDIELYDRDED